MAGLFAQRPSTSHSKPAAFVVAELFAGSGSQAGGAKAANTARQISVGDIQCCDPTLRHGRDQHTRQSGYWPLRLTPFAYSSYCDI